MKVLGINFSNDAAAALIIDGKISGAVQEERLSRIKHDASFPTKAIQWVLKEAGLKLADLDAVAFFWNPGIHAEAPNGRMTAVPRDHMEYLYSVPAHLLRQLDGSEVERVEQTFHLKNSTQGTIKPLKLHYLTHHTCHAAAAFYLSGYESAAILTVDGYGERTAAQISRGRRDGPIEVLHRIEFPHSVGSFYAAFTQFLGFEPNDGEGKVMGLASYGKPLYYEQIRKLVTLTERGFELDLSYFSFFVPRRRRFTQKLVDLLGPERRPESELTQRHMDIAASFQAVTEDVLLHLAQLARQLTGETRLCMAGGVTLNCVANSRIRFETGFEQCYFMPASSDAGTSLGAALYVAHQIGDQQGRADAPAVHPLIDYWGPGYSDAAIEAVLQLSGCTFERPADISQAAADLLAASKIVGWFQGRAEFGPRALGCRTILADPRPAEMKDIVNARVKFREWFRPFAPAVLEERAAEFFENGEVAPFMLVVYPTRPEHVHHLQAVTHVDGGARVQTVKRDDNPRYYDVIKAFGERTGVPVLMNTSFNIRGEPIVTTVEEALKCYFTTDMDALAVGPFLLKKPGKC